jgi:hypothetical protein
LIDIRVFPERGLLYVKQGCEIRFGRWSDPNHKRCSRLVLLTSRS